ncbi:WD40-repeat-containing domain protein [Cladochytrium replicatum]|nr:WD40-repeat-containing domain protein [Cladochytrium replicatum]
MEEAEQTAKTTELGDQNEAQNNLTAEILISGSNKQLAVEASSRTTVATPQNGLKAKSQSTNLGSTILKAGPSIPIITTATAANDSEPRGTPTIVEGATADLSPDSIMPLYLTTQTTELFRIRPGEDVNALKPFRMIPKSDFLADLHARAAISDFHPAKQAIIDYPGEELLVHWDCEFKYGQNFFLCIKPEAVDSILKPLVEEITPTDQPTVKTPQQRHWKSLGSDREMEAEAVIYNRDLTHVKMTRKRKAFGAPLKLSDRDSSHQYLECKPVKDPTYEVSRMELPVAVQAVPDLVDASAQTSWFRPLNKGVQYEPILMSEDDKEILCQLEDMEEFLKAAIVRVERVLQGNSLLDIFTDDYKHLGEEDMTIEQGTHTFLQENQSFTDLKHSKDKSISCVVWHPTQKGVVAISCTMPITFDERLEASAISQNKHNLIVIWSFHDPIHPQLMLEAPDEITCFEFNPMDPNLIAGGCVNGQIVLWDISDYSDKLKSSRKPRSAGDESGHNEESQGAAAQKETSMIKHIVVSSIDFGHRGPVQHIRWSKDMEITSSGEFVENGENGHRQVVSCSLDGQVLFWDMRYKKEVRALDLTWKPLLRVPLSSLDNTFDYGLTKFCLRSGYDAEKTSVTKSEKGSDKKSQTSLSSKFYSASEEGDLIYSDWIAEKSSEDKASRVEQAFSYHFGPMSDLQSSPFFPDIILSVGGWSFNVWKEGVSLGPLLSSAPSNAYAVCGQWSPTRPGVFYISKSDGTVEIWDLLDRSHAPSSVTNVASTAISAMSIHHYHGKGLQYQQFIAAGDDAGTLHILEVPRNLGKPSKNEKAMIRQLFDREVRRMQYVTQRRREAAQNAGNAAEVVKPVAGDSAAAPSPAGIPGASQQGTTADEEEERAEKEYLAMEKKILIQAGVLQEEIL